MFQPPSTNCEYYLSNKILNLVIIASLLAFSLVSAQGQIVLSKPCTDRWPEATATCIGWAKSTMRTHYNLIEGRAMSFKRCPGFIVWNHVRVYVKPTNTAIGTDAHASLFELNGPMLTFRSSTYT